jgi:hypothetical protein
MDFVETHRGASSSVIIFYSTKPEQFKECSIDLSEDARKLYKVELAEREYKDLGGIERKYNLELLPRDVCWEPHCIVNFHDKSKRHIPYTTYDRMLHPEIARNLMGRIIPEDDPRKTKYYNINDIQKPVEVKTILGLVKFLKPYGFGEMEIVPEFQNMDIEDIRNSGLPNDSVASFSLFSSPELRMHWHVENGELGMSHISDINLKKELDRIFGTTIEMGNLKVSWQT